VSLWWCRYSLPRTNKSVQPPLCQVLQRVSILRTPGVKVKVDDLPTDDGDFPWQTVKFPGDWQHFGMVWASVKLLNKQIFFRYLISHMCEIMEEIEAHTRISCVFIGWNDLLQSCSNDPWTIYIKYDNNAAWSHMANVQQFYCWMKYVKYSIGQQNEGDVCPWILFPWPQHCNIC